jgi:hypothetical protein
MRLSTHHHNTQKAPTKGRDAPSNLFRQSKEEKKRVNQKQQLRLLAADWLALINSHHRKNRRHHWCAVASPQQRQSPRWTHILIQDDFSLPLLIFKEPS